MKCGKCGTSISTSTKFCPSCGKEIVHDDHKVRFSRRPEEYKGPKKLYRSRNDRIIAGVCGGLGNYLEVDSNIIRIVWLLAIFAGGTGILAYIIAVALIPESPLDPWSEPKKQ